MSCLASMRSARRQISAEAMNCAPDDVELEDEENYAWTASCLDRRVHCTAGATAVGGQMGERIMCKPR